GLGSGTSPGIPILPGGTLETKARAGPSDSVRIRSPDETVSDWTSRTGWGAGWRPDHEVHPAAEAGSGSDRPRRARAGSGPGGTRSGGADSRVAHLGHGDYAGAQLGNGPEAPSAPPPTAEPVPAPVATQAPAVESEEPPVPQPAPSVTLQGGMTLQVRL